MTNTSLLCEKTDTQDGRHFIYGVGQGEQDSQPIRAQEGHFAESFQRKHAEGKKDDHACHDQNLDTGNVKRVALIEGNFHLASLLARKYIGRGIEFEDLYQEACIGLIDAANTFDETRGIHFSVHAVWRIRSALWGALEEKSRLIRLPAYVYRRVGVLSRIQQALSLELGRMPTEDDLAEKIRVNVKEIRNVLTVSLFPQSLEASLGDDDQWCLADMLADPTARNSGENIEYREMAAMVQRLLDHLTPLQRTILRLRYGFDDGESRTFAEVAKVLGVPHRSVQEVEEEAFVQLKKLLETKSGPNGDAITFGKRGEQHPHPNPYGTRSRVLSTSGSDAQKLPEKPVRYVQQMAFCGKKNCTTCTDGNGHGPYWYATWSEHGWNKTLYIGKFLPEQSPAENIKQQENVLHDTFHLQAAFCSKTRCRKCQPGGSGHGPYWYKYQRVNGCSKRTYVGKHLPPGIPASSIVQSKKNKKANE